MPGQGNKNLQNLQDLHLRGDFERYFGRTIFLLPETQRTKRSEEFLGSWLL